MNDEHPNKRSIQRYWFSRLPEERQVEYEDEMISREFEETHPTDDDKRRAKHEWETVSDCSPDYDILEWNITTCSSANVRTSGLSWLSSGAIWSWDSGRRLTGAEPGGGRSTATSSRIFSGSSLRSAPMIVIAMVRPA